MTHLAHERNPSRVYVLASAAGRDDTPAWFGNLHANRDDLTVEFGTATASASVSAEVLKEPLRCQIFAKRAARYPGFATTGPAPRARYPSSR